jgi:hypothetical protein
MQDGAEMKDRSEANILNDCLVALSAAGCLAWRNNTGQLLDRTGRPVKYGLCVGSSDIIGIAFDGGFLAIEVKMRLGQLTVQQRRFINAVIRAGGRAGVARNSDEAVQIALAKVTGKS